MLVRAIIVIGLLLALGWGLDYLDKGVDMPIIGPGETVTEEVIDPAAEGAKEPPTQNQTQGDLTEPPEGWAWSMDDQGKWKLVQIVTSPPASDNEEKEPLTGLPTLDVVDGRTTAYWKDPENMGFKEVVNFGGKDLAIQSDANDIVGAVTWDSLQAGIPDILTSFQNSKEDVLGVYLLNNIPTWLPEVLRYDDDGETALLIKVGQLDYRLWRITPETRFVPTSKDSLKRIQRQTDSSKGEPEEDPEKGPEDKPKEKAGGYSGQSAG